MIPALPFLRRHKKACFDSSAAVVLDIGDDVSSLWSSRTGVVAEPSRVAVDARGRVHGFGFDADIAVTEVSGALRVISPFEAGTDLLMAFVTWFVERAGVALCEEGPLFLPLSPDIARVGGAPLLRVVSGMGADTLVVHRPLAAAVALGLASDGTDCHLLAEVSESHIDLAVIRRGSVDLSLRLHSGHLATASVTVGDSLRTLDPDDELEILAKGAHLYGWAAPLHAEEVLTALDLPLAAPVGMGATVLTGTRRMAEEVLPWLLAER